MPEFSIQSSVDIARRLEIRGSDSRSWVVLLLPSGSSDTALRNLLGDLSSLLQRPTRVFDLRSSSFEKLSEILHEPEDDIVVLVAKTNLDTERWSALDLMRSGLERKGPIILWLSPDCVPNLSEQAPNIRSFVGGSIFYVGPDGGLMSEADRQKRLAELVQFYGLSNKEVVNRAQAKTLPSEPHFVEWLVLLGRGDLV